jgi:transcriptional regulator with XRE-family HTH domain
MSREQVHAFGRRVRDHRLKQGLSYYDVANRGGSRGSGALSASYVKLVENMDRQDGIPNSLHMSTPSLDSAFQLAKALGLTLSKLVEGIENEVAS